VSVGGVFFGYFLDKQKVTKTSASAALHTLITYYVSFNPPPGFITTCGASRHKKSPDINRGFQTSVYFFFPKTFFNTNDTIKLTVAPTAASNAVRTRSSASMFAKRIVSVPPAVPVFKKYESCIGTITFGHW
jgi:hypothetical protein